MDRAEDFEIRVIVESFFDFTQEDRTDDSAASPHKGNAAVI